MNFPNLSANFAHPMLQPQVNSAPVQDSSLDSVKRRDEAYKQSGAGAGATALAQLQDTVLNRLVEQIPGMDASELRQKDAADFTPEAVANRISQFIGEAVNNALKRGETDQQVQSLYDSAVQGMEKGIADATETLNSLGMMQGNIADQVNETAKRMREAVADIDPSRARDQVELSGGSGMAAIGMAERYQSASSFEMQLTTQDGDEVTITFGQMSDFSSSAAAYTDSNGTQVATFSMSSSQQMSYGYQIQGDLNKNEMSAIRDFVKQVNQMAGDFYSGDVRKAMEQGGNLSVDGSQIQSFEINMSQTQQYSAAAMAYQETQRIDQPDAARPGVMLGQLMQEMRDLFNGSQLNFLQNSQKQVGTDLFSQLVQQDTRMRDASPEDKERIQANLDNLLTSVNQEPTTTEQPASNTTV